VVRDSLLSIAGQLDTAMGGLEIERERLESHRRSVYFQHTPDVQVTFLKFSTKPIPTSVFSETKALCRTRRLLWRIAS